MQIKSNFISFLQNFLQYLILVSLFNPLSQKINLKINPYLKKTLFEMDIKEILILSITKKCKKIYVDDIDKELYRVLKKYCTNTDLLKSVFMSSVDSFFIEFYLSPDYENIIHEFKIKRKPNNKSFLFFEEFLQNQTEEDALLYRAAVNILLHEVKQKKDKKYHKRKEFDKLEYFRDL